MNRFHQMDGRWHLRSNPACISKLKFTGIRHGTLSLGGMQEHFIFVGFFHNSTGTKESIASIAQSGQDKSILSQGLIDVGNGKGDIGVGFAQRLESRVARNDRHDVNLWDTPLLQERRIEDT